jgi:hypothetical protein
MGSSEKTVSQMQGLPSDSDKPQAVGVNAPKSQHARFVETARKLRCDESEEAFNEKLKVVARHKPNPKQPSQKPRKE